MRRRRRRRRAKGGGNVASHIHELIFQLIKGDEPTAGSNTIFDDDVTKLGIMCPLPLPFLLLLAVSNWFKEESFFSSSPLFSNSKEREREFI